ncbi:hypothetical protein [Pseudanabaena sp. PCC 6802]|uniref:hypothetical protein n=1 Tax=Pseudanabaena sp. PCC 6802 TaxID=118173 RepID=UPI00034D5748|nr:hypothetical protein [Pseudanabaena sp. PCC 6802]
MSKITGIGWLAAALLVAAPIYAHEVEISGEVGATLHIEPDDRAKAGEPTQVWFALTEKGGKVIPLSECDCKLKVYTGKQTDKPLVEPPLKAIAVEQYQGIPGAEVTFPNVGAYKLELSGSPKSGAKFSPFNLSYDVVVAGKVETAKESPKPEQKPAETENKSGNKAEKLSEVSRQTESDSNTPLWWIVPTGILLTAGVVVGAIWLLRSDRG